MKKILALLIAMAMVFCISACTSKPEEAPVEDNELVEQQMQNEVEETPKSSVSTPDTNNYYKQAEPVKKQTSTTVAVSNAIIVEDNHNDMVIYKKKCDACGYVDPGTTRVTPGSFTGGFFCPTCKENKVIKIQTTYSY